MKIILFGSGDYYNKYKGWFNKSDILGILDNNQQKQGTVIDGIRVYAPREGVRLSYDKICILSVYYETIRAQLMNLGVSEKDIVSCMELYKYPEMAKERQDCFIFDKNGARVSCINNKAKDILMMSHDLDFNGATLAFYYIACILVKNGYQVWLATWTDGVVRQLLEKQGIGVIVDPNLQIEISRNINWMAEFCYVLCNTLLYSTLLSDRKESVRFIWWLHEPELFYQSIDKELTKRIRSDNLKAYAVGPVALTAFHNMFPFIDVRELLYGIPDVSEEYEQGSKNEKIEFVTIGNVQEYKGQDILIDSVGIIGREYREKIHVRIIGGKESLFFNEIKQKAEKFPDVIEFVPPLERSDVYKAYCDSDVFICTSRQDCMPVVVAESMMFSLPCIVSDSTGIAPYVKKSGGGLLFRCGDSMELADKIQWCVEHREDLQRMGKLARREYERSFSMRIFEVNILKAIHESFDI